MAKPLSNTNIKHINRANRGDLLNRELVILGQDITDPINVGHLVRIADGLGAKLLLTGQSVTPKHISSATTSMGLHRSLDWEFQPDTLTSLNNLKNSGFTLIAVEITPDAVRFDQYDYPAKCCLIVGNEARGVSKSVLQIVDQTVYIPMLGKGLSLNVHVAAAIVGYQMVVSS